MKSLRPWPGVHALALALHCRKPELARYSSQSAIGNRQIVYYLPSAGAGVVVVEVDSSVLVTAGASQELLV